MDEDDIESLAETAGGLADDAFTFKPEMQPDEPRDPTWLRWTKFAVIILFLAVLVGFVSFCEYYLEQYWFAKHFLDEAAAERIAGDPLRPMKIRIVIGAVIGGGLGMIYVGRCIARGVDP